MKSAGKTEDVPVRGDVVWETPDPRGTLMDRADALGDLLELIRARNAILGASVQANPPPPPGPSRFVQGVLRGAAPIVTDLSRRTVAKLLEPEVPAGPSGPIVPYEDPLLADVQASPSADSLRRFPGPGGRILRRMRS